MTSLSIISLYRDGGVLNFKKQMQVKKNPYKTLSVEEGCQK